ncbi:MAG: hypothetical protein FWF96_02460, partial [Kiritimatiellaeota bacterium]|nr:hypothetical protein [Kiritimatiellota bacterium]
MHERELVEPYAFHFAGVVARMCETDEEADAAFLAAFLTAQQRQEARLPVSKLAGATLGQILGLPNEDATPLPADFIEKLPNHVCAQKVGRAVPARRPWDSQP